MRSLKNISCQILTYIVGDDDLLFIFQATKTITQVICLDCKTLSIFYERERPGRLSIFRPKANKELVCFLNSRSELVILYKLDGTEAHTVKLSPLMPFSNPVFYLDSIFLVAAVPTRDRRQMNLEKFCLVSVDSRSGKIQYKTQFFTGQPSAQPVVYNESILITAGTQIMKFDLSGNLIETGSLSMVPDYPPLVFADCIMCCSIAGTAEVLAQEFISEKRILTGKISYAPFIWEDKISFVSGDSIFDLNINKGSTTRVCSNSEPIQGNPTTDFSNIYVGDRCGSLMCFNRGSKALDALSLSDKPLLDPVITSHGIIIGDNSNLWLISP